MHESTSRVLLRVSVVLNYIAYLTYLNLVHYAHPVHSLESEHKIVQNPEPIDVPLGDLVSFDCVAGLKPERFEWLHLPRWPPSFSHAKSIEHKRYDFRGNSTKLQFKVSNTSPGGYQCVAWYGALAIASTPARLSLAQIEQFKPFNSEKYFVTPGNTVVITCPEPKSNPPAQIDFHRQRHGKAKELQIYGNSLILQNVTSEDSDIYSCSASNYILSKTNYAPFNYTLNVGFHKNKEAPRFLKVPPSNYTVLSGENITLECSAVGTPPPTISWRRIDNKPLLPRDRFEQTLWGLKIAHVSRADEGIYICEASNGVMPPISYHLTLFLNEIPVITSGPAPAVVTEGERLEMECLVEGRPEPTVSWVVNSRSVQNDTLIEAIGNKIYIDPVEKRHAGKIQCFATNSAGTVYKSASVTVYPKQISSYDFNESEKTAENHVSAANQSQRGNRNGHKPKKPTKNKKKMIPPSRPNITRLSDTSVMVRWSVPENDGVPITLFKIQYREINSNDPERAPMIKNSKWNTLSANIPPSVTTYEVDNLWTDSVYKFRVAAVYSNNDNKSGPNSAKFHLVRGPFIGKNPLPTPVLTHAEAVNQSTIRIYWDLNNSENTSIEGFYVYYRDLSSAEDYMKETVDDPSATTCLLSHLSASKVYEFKLQSFTASGASDFSAILNRKTLAAIVNTTSSTTSKTNKGIKATEAQNNGISWLYLTIAVGVGLLTVLLSLGVLLVACKQYKRNKSQNLEANELSRNDKRSTNDLTNQPIHHHHHIQADSKDYTKNSIGKRTMHNGCVAPGPKLTITPNPLAEEEKNTNIEMTSFIHANNDVAVTNAVSNANHVTNHQTTHPIANNNSLLKKNNVCNVGNSQSQGGGVIGANGDSRDNRENRDNNNRHSSGSLSSVASRKGAIIVAKDVMCDRRKDLKRYKHTISASPSALTPLNYVENYV